jgi:hypothetical protein
LEEEVAASVYKTEIASVGIRRADHVTPLYPQKLAQTLLTSSGRLVGIVCLPTKAMEFIIIHQLKVQTFQETNAFNKICGFYLFSGRPSLPPSPNPVPVLL